jgi:hypothetical protein
MPVGVHVVTVTPVASDTIFGPGAIAEHYWRLHVQPADDWDQSVFSTPSPTRPAGKRSPDRPERSVYPALTCIGQSQALVSENSRGRQTIEGRILRGTR